MQNSTHQLSADHVLFMEYRNYLVFKKIAPETFIYSNHDGTPANDIPDGKPSHTIKKLLYQTTVRRKHGLNKNLNIHSASVGGYDGFENQYSKHQLDYTQKAIDRHIENRKENQLTKVNHHKNSRWYTYICNNVTINVFFDGGIGGDYINDRSEIYVNNRPLRSVSLTNDFTFNDVLKQVYYNTIANYNVYNFDSQYLKKNYFKNRKIETIDIDILPVYELLGAGIQYKDLVFAPTNVQKSCTYDGFKFTYDGNKEVIIPVNEIKDIIFDVECELNEWLKLSILTKKLQFIE